MYLLVTFLTILAKCILFYGFLLDPTHTSADVYSAVYLSSFRIQFYAAFILLFLSFAFLLKQPARFWYLTVFNAGVTLFILMDLWYVRGFNTLPTVHLLQQTTNLNNLSGSIFALLRWIDLVFVADLAAFIWFCRKSRRCQREERRKIAAFFASFALSLAVIAYIPIRTEVFGMKDEKAIFRMYDPLITCYNLSPIGYHLMDGYAYLKDSRPLHLTPEQRAAIEEWFESKQEHMPDNAYKGMLAGKNLIVIQVESLEQFVIGRKWDGQEITPNINRLLQHSLYFTNIMEQVNEGTTSDAELMINTSVYPLRKGSTFFRYPFTTYNSLPDLLEKRGYRTLAAHPDQGTYWNWTQALSAIGFEETIEESRFELDEMFGMGLSDGSFFRQTVPILANTPQPFYAFLVTMSSHSPYELPDELRELQLEPEVDESPVGDYLQSIRYVDTQIGRFLEMLEEKNLLANTVIVITGDHEGIHKYFGEEMEAYPQYANGKRLPFIIHHPDLQPKEFRMYGGQIDILPTLAYLMGVEETEYAHTAMGRNLLKTNQSFAVLSNGRYVGEAVPSDVQDRRVQGLEIADQIIRSNFFKR